MIHSVVCGNLGKDAEIKTINGGKVVCNFSVASTGRDKATTWVGCALWGVRAEKVHKYLTKGTKVAVSGQLTTREHNGKTYLEIDVSELELMGGGRREDEPRDEEPRRGARHQQSLDSRGPSDDEIPF